MKKKWLFSAALVSGLIGICGLRVLGQTSQALHEIQIRISVGEAAPSGLAFLTARPDYGQVTIKSQRSIRGNLPRERHPELSEDHLVVTAVDNRGMEGFRMIIPDPRLLRAETADASGRLSQVVFYRLSVDFWITLPEDPSFDRILVFQPQWSGTGFNLLPIGEARLR
jgi:hypothetical protein